MTPKPGWPVVPPSGPGETLGQSKVDRRPRFPATVPGLGAAAPRAQPAGSAVASDGLTKRSASTNFKSPPSGVGLDSSVVRQAMVHKLAQQGVSSPEVLRAMGLTQRHLFVDSALVNQAYEDTSLPIGFGQTISKPNVVARMCELLVHESSVPLGRVLEIGTGCGYQAAVLSCLATEVYSLERIRGLHERARVNLRALRLPHVHLIFADGMQGYAAGAPYAAIIAAAGGEALPQAWLDQLAVGGRLVAPMQTGPGVQALVVVDRTASGFTRSILEPVMFVPLKSGVV